MLSALLMKVINILPLKQKPTGSLEELKKNSVMKSKGKSLPIRHIDLAFGTLLISGDIMVPSQDVHFGLQPLPVISGHLLVSKWPSNVCTLF